MQCVPLSDCDLVEPRTRLNAVLAEVEQLSLGCLERIIDLLRDTNSVLLDPDMRGRMDTLKHAVSTVVAQTLGAQMVVALQAELAQR